MCFIRSFLLPAGLIVRRKFFIGFLFHPRGAGCVRLPARCCVNVCVWSLICSLIGRLHQPLPRVCQCVLVCRAPGRHPNVCAASSFPVFQHLTLRPTLLRCLSNLNELELRVTILGHILRLIAKKRRIQLISQRLVGTFGAPAGAMSAPRPGGVPPQLHPSASLPRWPR